MSFVKKVFIGFTVFIGFLMLMSLIRNIEDKVSPPQPNSNKPASYVNSFSPNSELRTKLSLDSLIQAQKAMEFHDLAVDSHLLNSSELRDRAQDIYEQGPGPFTVEEELSGVTYVEKKLLEGGYGVIFTFDTPTVPVFSSENDAEESSHLGYRDDTSAAYRDFSSKHESFMTFDNVKIQIDLQGNLKDVYHVHFLEGPNKGLYGWIARKYVMTDELSKEIHSAVGSANQN